MNDQTEVSARVCENLLALLQGLKFPPIMRACAREARDLLTSKSTGPPAPCRRRGKERRGAKVDKLASFATPPMQQRKQEAKSALCSVR